MANTPTRVGSANASEIYLSVGVALSYWEASEDVLMGLFKWTCGINEPTAFELYVAAPRSIRSKMILSALERYSFRFSQEELGVIRNALKVLDKLAPMRNQIAHGHVSKTTHTEDGVVVMQGNFLVPSLNEAGEPVPRSFRYAHTAAEIDAWRDKVREERWSIYQTHLAAMTRAQSLASSLQPRSVKT